MNRSRSTTISTCQTLAVVALLVHLSILFRWIRAPEALPPLAGDLRIDINRASAEEFSILPQIGPVLAQRVVENRERLGVFPSVDDLDRVHGIGPSILGQIRPYCDVVDEVRPFDE